MGFKTCSKHYKCKNIELHDVLKDNLFNSNTTMFKFGVDTKKIGEEICLKRTLSQKMLNYKLTNLNKSILFLPSIRELIQGKST